MVAPYPEFFSGLARLARRTAEAFDHYGLEQPFSVPATASNLLQSLSLGQRLAQIHDSQELERLSGRLEQFGQFQNRYFEQHQVRLRADGPSAAHEKLQAELEALARECAESGEASEAQEQALRAFFECRQSTVRMLNDFAPLCDRLATLATKSLAGQSLTEEDAKWIQDYGVTLARFHFYYGNSYEVPRDDFPIVTRVFSNPQTGSMLYVGLARPQALYVIVADGDSRQLYRGAVMTYREFTHPHTEPLEDTSWREMISRGQAPPVPPFARSFYVETPVQELLERLRRLNRSADDPQVDPEGILWQVGSRANAGDLPENR